MLYVYVRTYVDSTYTTLHLNIETFFFLDFRVKTVLILSKASAAAAVFVVRCVFFVFFFFLESPYKGGERMQRENQPTYTAGARVLKKNNFGVQEQTSYLVFCFPDLIDLTLVGP